MNIQLREWQKEALKKSHNWLLKLDNRNFLINGPQVQEKQLHPVQLLNH